jgi:hypothetical protein
MRAGPTDGAAAAPLLFALRVAGEQLAAAVRAENEALTALDMTLATGRAEAKIRAVAAFAAAHAATARAGERATGADAADLAGIAADLAGLIERNRELLRRAIRVQARVVEAIAAAALPSAASAGQGLRYGAGGRRSGPAQPVPLAVHRRA